MPHLIVDPESTSLQERLALIKTPRKSRKRFPALPFLVEEDPVWYNETYDDGSWAWNDQIASIDPSKPPATAMTRLSVSSWRTRRPRPAPRTATR